MSKLHHRVFRSWLSRQSKHTGLRVRNPGLIMYAKRESCPLFSSKVEIKAPYLQCQLWGWSSVADPRVDMASVGAAAMFQFHVFKRPRPNTVDVSSNTVTLKPSPKSHNHP